MPCDVNTVDNLEKYEDVLNEVSSIITNKNALYVCMAGDLSIYKVSLSPAQFTWCLPLRVGSYLKVGTRGLYYSLW